MRNGANDETIVSLSKKGANDETIVSFFKSGERQNQDLDFRLNASSVFLKTSFERRVSFFYEAVTLRSVPVKLALKGCLEFGVIRICKS